MFQILTAIFFALSVSAAAQAAEPSPAPDHAMAGHAMKHGTAGHAMSGHGMKHDKMAGHGMKHDKMPGHAMSHPSPGASP